MSNVLVADLHTHSTASDGEHSPAELVRLAKARGIRALSITDHDTIAGLGEALEAGDELGVKMIRGVELSAGEYHSFHILGYGFGAHPEPLLAICRRFQRGREERKHLIHDYLKGQGVPVSLAEVEEIAGGAIIGRPHFAQAMVRRGYVASNREAFARYLDADGYHKLPVFKLSARECIDAIKNAGGKASLAHPYQLKMENHALEALVKKLCGWGLDAVECYYPKHTAGQQSFYLSLAEKYNLHATGGSDFHGKSVKPDVEMAGWNLDIEWMFAG